MMPLQSTQPSPIPLGCPPYSPSPARPPARPLAQAARAAAAQLPDFFPPEAAEIEEPAARDMMAAMRRVPLEVPGLGTAQTAVVGPPRRDPAKPAFVLLHGFDSSSLEFRRFHPLLSELGDVYAVDLAGWGFTDAGFANGNAAAALGPAQKRAHLRAFLKQVRRGVLGAGV